LPNLEEESVGACRQVLQAALPTRPLTISQPFIAAPSLRGSPETWSLRITLACFPIAFVRAYRGRNGRGLNPT
jgi:hypothetical protein